MSVVRNDARRRWSVVGAGVLVLCLLPVAAALRPAPGVRLAPANLRGLILGSASRPYQGNIDSHASFGLPALPQLGDVAGLLGGSTSIRAWYASPAAWRVAQVESGGERDIYQTSGGTYLWDFQSNLLTQVTGALPVRLPWASDLTPPELARRLLGDSAPQDRLSTLPARRVAGVAAAGMRLVPADPSTTIGRVDVWADPRTGLPLQVEVGTRGATRPVLTTRFMDLDQHAPGQDVLTPVRAASAGFTVTNRPDAASAINSVGPVRLPESLAGRDRVVVPGDSALSGDAALTGVAAYGSGLSRFVVIPLPGRVGCESMRTLREANAARVTLVDGQGYRATSPALTTLVVRATSGDRDADDPAFLIAGLVSPSLLDQAATDLFRIPRR